MSTVLDTQKKPSFDDWRKRIGLPLAIILAIVVLILPTPEGLSPEGHKALAMFVGIFILYLTEAIPLPITSLAVIPITVLLGIMKVGPALEGFASSALWLMVGAFILSAAMVKSRLGERITYKIMDGIGTTVTRITLGVTMANIVLAFLIPSSTARVALMLPIILGILKIFDAESHPKLAICLLLTTCFTGASMSPGVMTATITNPVTIEFIEKGGGTAITYMQWLMYGLPPALVVTFLCWAVVRFMNKPEISDLPGGKKYIQEKLAEMGPLSSLEKRSAFVFILVVLLWATGQWTNIDATTACLISASLFFLPKFGFLSWGEANKGVAWQIVLICGGGVSLGNILMETGAAEWIALKLFHALGFESLALVAMILIIMFIVQYMHLLFVGTTAMGTAIMPIVVSLAGVAGVNPALFALPAGMIVASGPMLMFYCTLPNILVYGTGHLSVSDFPKSGFIICTVAVLIYALCAVTLWPMLGMY